ncbi:MAG: hypothetical protein WKF89_13545 [Chitinophagaceae bacterium]
MKVYKIENAIVIEHNDNCFLSELVDWDRFINRDNLYDLLMEEISSGSPDADSSC